MTHESLSGDSVEATPYKNPRTLGPETQMLNLRILQNLAQNNIYRDETSKEGVRVLERALLGEHCLFDTFCRAADRPYCGVAD